MDTILRTYDLTKNYKDKIVVNRVNMTINKGDIYGFLGQNGAGKTTTIRLIMGHIKASGGSIELFGEPVDAKSYMHKSRIGVLMDAPCFYPKLTVQENLEVYRRYMGIQNKKRIDEVLALLELDKVSDKVVNKFSFGMKQRVEIAKALLNEPEFLILDEYTNGLDPEGIKNLREVILKLNREHNVTVLMSSHILSEIESIATKVGIIHKGALLEEMDYSSIKEKSRQYLTIRVKDEKKAAMVLEQKCGITQYRVYEDGLINIFENIEMPEYISQQIVENGIGISELKMNNENLEDYFLRLIGGSKND
jgi:bacitracin transport system ATP-binding protein